MEVDRNDAPKGFIAIETSNLDCEKCFFYEDLTCKDKKDANCYPEVRHDRQFVVFVKDTK